MLKDPGDTIYDWITKIRGNITQKFYIIDNIAIVDIIVIIIMIMIIIIIIIIIITIDIFHIINIISKRNDDTLRAQTSCKNGCQLYALEVLFWTLFLS